MEKLNPVLYTNFAESQLVKKMDKDDYLKF